MRRTHLIRSIGSALTFAAIVSGCGDAPPRALPSETAGERMPGPAAVWLTSEPAAPSSRVDIVMTSPDDAGIWLGHTFVAGRPLRGSFATSQGSYSLAALGGACTLPLVLGPSEAADVLLTITGPSACGLAVVRRGRLDDPAIRGTDDAVLITNGGAGAETPAVEPGAVPEAP
jgi:hypothetical protein